MKYLILFLVSIFLIACSPQKRLARLVKKHPELLHHDTIVKIDTVTITTMRVDHDTTFLEKGTDTVTIQKDNLTVRYIRVRDSIYLSGTCDTIKETVIREVKVDCPKAVLADVPFYMELGFYLFLLVLIVTLIFRKRFNNLFKPSCPNCGSIDSTIECFAGNPYVKTERWKKGRQCKNCPNFWYK